MTSAASVIPTCALPAHPTLACPWCGQLHTRVPMRPRDVSECVRCGAHLARGHASDWLVTLAWVCTGLILWVPANLLPIVSLAQFGNNRESLLFTGAVGLWQHGMPWIAALVALTGIVAPLGVLLALAAVLTPIALGRAAPRLGFLARWLRVFELWSLPEVYLLGILVAFIKLGSVVHAEPAAGLWCHGIMAVALLVAWRRFDFDAAMEALTAGKPRTRHLMDATLHCEACTLAVSAPEAAPASCPRCGAPLHHRRPAALARSTAFAVAGVIMLVPANVLPVLTTSLLGQPRTDTIFSGVLSLYRDGLWGIALIVFTASIVVPLLKLASLGVLLHAIHTGSTARRRGLTRLYAFVKFIGRWSMLDVFLVAFLTGAVRFGSLASVRPEPGVIAFAAAVVLTIFATEAFDSRLLWDRDDQTESPSP